MKESFYKLLRFTAFIPALVIFAGCFNKNSGTIKAEIDFWDFPNFSSESGVAGDFEKNLIIKEVYLLNSFPKYDIFHFEGRDIISEKLLNAFQENNITGYEVSEYNILKLE